MNLHKKRNEIWCQHKDFCSHCGARYKEQMCELCGYYKAIDSGVGWCICNPEPLLTEWCRDICGQFIDKEMLDGCRRENRR